MSTAPQIKTALPVLTGQSSNHTPEKLRWEAVFSSSWILFRRRRGSASGSDLGRSRPEQGPWE
jgi:hypothetical protein